MVPSKYLNNFWKTLEMSLINCEINLTLTWSANYVAIDVLCNRSTFTIIDTKHYVPFVSLSTQDNAKLLQQLKSGFKRIINWHEFQSEVIVQERKRYLDYFIDPGFPRVIMIFFQISFENNTGGASYKRYYLPQLEMKDYNVMVYARNILD